MQLYAPLCYAQNGFQPGKSCAQHMVAVVETIGEIIRDKKQPICFFLDLSKAFDKISWKHLFKRLRGIGCSDEYIACMRKLYTDTKMHIRVNGKIGDPLDTCAGIAQDQCSSPLMFCIAFDPILRELDKSGLCRVVRRKRGDMGEEIYNDPPVSS